MPNNNINDSDADTDISFSEEPVFTFDKEDIKTTIDFIWSFIEFAIYMYDKYGIVNKETYKKNKIINLESFKKLQPLYTLLPYVYINMTMK